MTIPIAQIIKVEAPASAPAGEYVIIDVHLKNNSTNYISLGVTGVYDSSLLSWQFGYLGFLPYETLIFRGWFTMPSKNVRLTIWSWYWDIGLADWVLDETEYVDISLTGLVPAFSEFAVASFQKG